MMKIRLSIILLFFFGWQAWSSDLTGRIGLRWYGIQSDAAQNRSLSAPGLYVRLGVAELLDTPSHFYVYMRGERNRYYNEISKVRVYSLKLSLQPFAGRVHMDVGRLNSRWLGAYGLLDGGSLTLDVNKHISVGAFSGHTPVLSSFRTDQKTQRYGVYSSVRVKGVYSGGLSFITQHYLGELDRQFLLFNNLLTLDEHFSFYQFAEVDLRTLSPAGGSQSALRLTNLFARLQYRANHRFSAYVTVDSRKDVVYLQTNRSLPDSLFEANVDKRFTIGARWRPVLPWLVHASYKIGTSTRSNDAHTFFNFMISNYDLFGSGLYAEMNLSWNSSNYLQSSNRYIMLQYPLKRWLRLTADWMTNELQYVYNPQVYDENFYGIGVYLLLNKRASLQARISRLKSELYSENRIYLEFSYRFLKNRSKP